jgi:phospholipase/carboxylesterase
VLQIPANAGSDPLPLLVLLHGAGGSGANQLARFGAAPSDAGVVVLAPDSRDVSWDAIRGDYGPDIAFLNRALARVFETVSVDPARLTLGGFSDGATYAISIGLINGDLFPRVIGFSAGFVIPGELHGHPSFFMSHGTSDPILPIERCGRVISQDLKRRAST